MRTYRLLKFIIQQSSKLGECRAEARTAYNVLEDPNEVRAQRGRVKRGVQATTDYPSKLLITSAKI